ncbi:MAG: hypothetical protein MUE84_08635, partial [Hyphomonas sp.]|nr:hypothetical protein [Hyphomonas sp.]
MAKLRPSIAPVETPAIENPRADHTEPAAKVLTITGHSLQDLISVVDAGQSKEKSTGSEVASGLAEDISLGLLVQQSDVSVRLANCLGRMDSTLSAMTVAEALAHPDEFRRECHATRSIGAKTISELQALIASYAAGKAKLRPAVAPEAPEGPVKTPFTCSLTVADAVNGRDLSARLTNVLQSSAELRSFRLDDYAREPETFAKWVRSLKNVGRRTVGELTDILTEVVDYLLAGQAVGGDLPASDGANAMMQNIGAVNLGLPGSSPEERCRELIERLDERKRHVIMRRYGLDGSKAETLEELGARNGVTRERVRQIEAKAIRLLGGASQKAEFQHLLDQMADTQWHALTDGHTTLTEEDFFLRKNGVDPLFSLAADLCHDGLEGWLDRIAVRVGEGWIRAAQDGEGQLAETLRQLDGIERQMRWPQPIDLVAQACKTETQLVAQAVRLHTKARLLDDYVNFGYTGPTARRTVGLHRATRGMP